MSLIFISPFFAQAAFLSCNWDREIKVFYDKGTKVVYKKNAASLPTKEVLSNNVHCMSEYSGSIAKSTTPWSNGGENTRYTLATLDNGGNEWTGYAQFLDRGDGTAFFSCNSPLVGRIEFHLTNCSMVDKLEP